MKTEPTIRRHEAKLTTREAQVLACLARGLSYPETGAELGIEKTTVAVFVQNIRKKFRTKTRDALIELAIEQGLVK